MTAPSLLSIEELGGMTAFDAGVMTAAPPRRIKLEYMGRTFELEGEGAIAIGRDEAS